MEPVLREIRLQNLLSFGPDTPPLELKSLNVLIGPNGSGKSNLLEAIGLLHAAPKDLWAPVRESGGVAEWLWQGQRNATATVEAKIHDPSQPDSPWQHSFSFAEQDRRFTVTAERIEKAGAAEPLYVYGGGEFRIQVVDDPSRSQVPRPAIKTNESILSQRKDPERYPWLSYLSDLYSKFRLYREWSFGRNSPPRQPQKPDLSAVYLEENCQNLAHVLNALRLTEKPRLLELLSTLYPEIKDFSVQFPTGWVQLFLEENSFNIPATRLSDGTLRFLCLLAILCHPEPPPLVCIEEPELGLHPDVLSTLAELIIDASKRCQLIVTTHSDLLVDNLTEIPDAVVVCEKHKGATEMRRLDSERLKAWLEKYTLGQLWMQGELGGTRW